MQKNLVHVKILFQSLCIQIIIINIIIIIIIIEKLSFISCVCVIMFYQFENLCYDVFRDTTCMHYCVYCPSVYFCYSVCCN